jgi:uncharacterized protein with FMN-binding domain
MHRAIPAVLATAAAFVVVWQFAPHPTTVTTPPGASAPVATGGSGTSGTSGAAGSQAVDGTAQSTPWGTLQVRAVFANGKLTDVQMVQTPSDRHTTRVLPTLRSEALQAQSANIHSVSGATITSDAYAQSLQAAIDARTS